jgi:hypothetical protein
MQLTLQELINHLAQNYNEVQILELLNIDSQDILDRFEDIVENRYSYILAEIELLEEEDEDEQGND